MGRRGVEVVIELLDVLAVIALAVGQAEQPLLQDRVSAVPQGQREAQPLAAVADAGDAVLAPAVGARARLIVREVLPGVAVRAVVLAHRAPLALAEIRPPQLPARRAARVLGEADAFGGRPHGHAGRLEARSPGGDLILEQLRNPPSDDGADALLLALAASTRAAPAGRTCTGSSRRPSGGCAWRAGSRYRAPSRTSCRAGPARSRRPRCRAAPPR